MNTKEKSPGLVVADAGFDSWFANSRGSEYCINHTTLNTSTDQFWDYSFTEIGLYDTPAVINFIKEQTGYKKVSYIGHS